MMGRREGGQGQFFYAFDLDKVVPPDHLVRQIDAMLELSWVHKEFAPYYARARGKATRCAQKLRPVAASWARRCPHRDRQGLILAQRGHSAKNLGHPWLQHA